MEKLYFLFFLAIICTFPNLIHGECCETEKFYFTRLTNTYSCYSYGGRIPEKHENGTELTKRQYDEVSAYLHCEISLCKDGKAPKGQYCGIGSCGFWNCNCKGGCIQGDAVKNFQALHATEIYNVRNVLYNNNKENQTLTSNLPVPLIQLKNEIVTSFKEQVASVSSQVMSNSKKIEQIYKHFNITNEP